jgi:hypothetical protein
MSFQFRAFDLAHAFELKTREDGSTYYTIRDGSPDWMIEAVMAAHDEELPNDWRYSVCNFLAQNLAEYDSAEEAYEHVGELAESQSTVYTSELLSWYAERPSRLDYADQAEENMGYGHDPGAITGDRLHLGHYYAIQQMAELLISACEERSRQMDAQMVGV